MDRRRFLKMAGLSAATGLAMRPGAAVARGLAGPKGRKRSADTFAILFDATRCVGCRGCETACAEANGLPEPEGDDDVAFAKRRDTTASQLVVINRFETSRGEVFARRSCMHCQQPACATGCLTQALKKTEEGPVVWRAGKCMGCRYCMLNCPFDIPKYEYHSNIPRVMKCKMCYERVVDGEDPACVEECPEEAIVFGKRGELLREARKRMVESPDDYVHHIYGEREAGGTSLLYLSGVPFEELGMRTDLGTVAYPEYTKEFLYAVPVVFTLVPTLLLGLSQAHRRGGGATGERGEGPEGQARGRAGARAGRSSSSALSSGRRGGQGGA